MNNSLAATGLSMSQAQSISNLCNQEAVEIQRKFLGINNASKTFKQNGESFIYEEGRGLPATTVQLLTRKSTLHALQAFLMENMKAKEAKIQRLKNEQCDLSDLESPASIEYKEYIPIGMVNEDWGWAQLTTSELNEYYECEAFAAHFGQFIHKDGILSKLRDGLTTLKSVEFVQLKKDENTPVIVQAHHDSANLLILHNELAAIHRKYEQRVNYYKAKVKNLVSARNIEISKTNADALNTINAENTKLRQAYKLAMDAHIEKCSELKEKFEAQRQARITEASALRINVDERFKPMVDEFLKNVTES